MKHVQCKYTISPSHFRKIEWLRTFYQNSGAHHERNILRYSKSHQRDVKLLTDAWTQNKRCPSALEIKPLRSPGLCPGFDDLDLHLDLDVQDYMGVVYSNDDM
jgi:hypothetical protein